MYRPWLGEARAGKCGCKWVVLIRYGGRREGESKEWAGGALSGRERQEKRGEVPSKFQLRIEMASRKVRAGRSNPKRGQYEGLKEGHRSLCVLAHERVEDSLRLGVSNQINIS
jgi:hypothetical protein